MIEVRFKSQIKTLDEFYIFNAFKRKIFISMQDTLIKNEITSLIRELERLDTNF